MDTVHRYAVIDVEGNGQQPPEIVEIAITPVDGADVAAPLCWLVKPDKPINPIVTRKVHGIRNADVADAPSFTNITPEVLAALAGRTPVAHNAQVEYGVLRRHLPAWQPPVMLDTLRLAKHVWPGLPSYGLDHLLAHTGITADDSHGRRHRAAWDCHATASLFVAMAAEAGDHARLIELACLPALAAAAPQEPVQGGLW